MPIDTSSHEKCMSTEIEYLMKEKGYERKRAVAAAMSICKEVKKNELELEILKKMMEIRVMSNE